MGAGFRTALLAIVMCMATHLLGAARGDTRGTISKPLTVVAAAMPDPGVLASLTGTAATARRRLLHEPPGSLPGLQVEVWSQYGRSQSLPIPADSPPSSVAWAPNVSYGGDESPSPLTSLAGARTDFALRFTGIITLSSSVAKDYTFWMANDDDAMLFIDDELRISRPGVTGFKGYYRREVKLTPGAHTFRVDYCQRDGAAGLEVLVASGNEEYPSPIQSSMLSHLPKATSQSRKLQSTNVSPTPTPSDDYLDPEIAFLNTPSPPPVKEKSNPPVVSRAAVAPPKTGALGLWGPLIKFPLVPVAAALVSDTQLLTWSAYSVSRFQQGASGNTFTATLDLTTLAVTELNVVKTNHDMFCPGISMLPDGSIMVTGGDSAKKTSIYNPVTADWTTAAAMNKGRGYQATATLSDGRVFVLGGSWNGGVGNKDGEVWSAAEGWKPIYGCSAKPMLTHDTAVGKRDVHAKLFAWSGGTVFQAGPSHEMNWYDIDGNTTVPAGARGTDPDAMNGNAVMYDAGSARILTIGGSQDYTPVGGSPAAAIVATANANIVNVPKYGHIATVQAVAPMHYPRAFCNAVVLSDGKVLVIGGQMKPVIFTDGPSDVYPPELWDPHTRQWTVMANLTAPRNYHSIAVLLPDGRVFSGGGGLCGAGCRANHFDGQIFTPPNLLNADGSAAVRPVITAAPSSVGPGDKLHVTTDSPISKFNIIRRGTSTHSVDTDQRFIKLANAKFTGTDKLGYHYTMQMLNDPGIALPGIWMLFALNAAGVSSVSWTVQITV